MTVLRALRFAPLAALLVVRVAAAQPSAADRADALFQEGKTALTAGDLKTACPKFAESEHLQQAAGTLLNWADCEERAGHIAKALALFQQGRSQLKSDDFRVAFADGRIQALTARVPTLAITLGRGVPASARVSLDGAALDASTLTTPEPVEPGAHALVLHVDGHDDRKLDVTLADGDRRAVELDPGPVTAATSPASGVTSGAPSTSRNGLAFAALGVGAVGIVAGTVTGLMTASAAATYKDHCTAGACDGEGLDAASRGRVVSIVSPLSFGVGAVAAAAGIYLLVSGPSRSGAAAMVSPLVSPTIAGLGVSGGF